MEKHKRLLRLLTAVVFGILILTYFAFPAFSGAESSSTPPNYLLNGEYAVTQFQRCVYTSGDFDTPENSFQIVGGPFFNADVTIEALWYFDGNGTGRTEGHVLAFTHGSSSGTYEYSMGNTPISETQGTCDMSYAVDSNNSSFTISTSNCSGEYLWPVKVYPNCGAFSSPCKRTYTSTGGLLKGRIGSNGSTLLIYKAEPEKSTLNVTIPWQTPSEVSIMRICSNTGSAIRISSINQADVNDDGTVNVLDAIKVLRISLGLE